MNTRDAALAGAPPPMWRRMLARLRAAHEAQVALWEHTQRGLEPWRESGPLRWRAGQLDGVVLPEEPHPSPSP